LDKWLFDINWMFKLVEESGDVVVLVQHKFLAKTNNKSQIYLQSLFYTQDVAAYIKKEFDKKHNPTW